jgi:hypothetical protein
MIILKKKEVLQELAVSLYLMLTIDRGTTSPSVINRLEEKSRDALNAAQCYTGVLGDKERRAFLEAKPLRFTIDCGSDIVRGDTIRFLEQVINNRVNPSRSIGTRGIIAEVMGMSIVRGEEMFHMRVISSGGTWGLSADETIYRPPRLVTRMEVMRIPWEDESKRTSRDSCTTVIDQKDPVQEIKTTSQKTLGRYDILKEMGNLLSS